MAGLYLLVDREGSLADRTIPELVIAFRLPLVITTCLGEPAPQVRPVVDHQAARIGSRRRATISTGADVSAPSANPFSSINSGTRSASLSRRASSVSASV